MLDNVPTPNFSLEAHQNDYRSAIRKLEKAEQSKIRIPKMHRTNPKPIRDGS